MRHAIVTLGLLLGLASLAPALADSRTGRVSATLPALLEGEDAEIKVSADRLEQTRSGDAILEGDVTLQWGRSRMQADRITFREKRFVEANGNVLVVWGGNRIAGARMTYDLQTDRGVIEDAIGQVEPEFYFWADRAEKVGKDRVNLDSASITTCTQPIPYWSFSVSSAKVRLNHYAHLWNLRLRAGRVPIFYLPYLVWPVKRDRAAGLLFPEFGTTRDRGEVISQGMFIPFGRSSDLTLFGEYYTRAGWGGGGELRLVPNRQGSAVLNGFYIRDQVAGFGRHRVTYRQTQEFLNGFRMVADVNHVSDFGFFTDFEREIRLASSPTILARVELTRNGTWTSVNVREVRREQLFSDGTSLVQQALPELEWRGRSRRLGKTPFYLSFESSVASVQQRGESIDADYRRADFFPTVTAPLSPLSWLDITPSVSYRATHYTQQRQPDLGPEGEVVVVHDSLTRGVGSAGLEIVGPKLARVFRGSAEDSPSYKHTFETVLAYSYSEGSKRNDEVLVYDEVDRSIAARNQVSYGFRSRLFARRARAEQPMVPLSPERIVLPEAEAGPPVPEGALSDRTPPGSAPQEPVEIVSLEVVQRRSLDRDLRADDVDGDGTDETSRYSNIELTGRYNPGPRADLNLRVTYDILFHEVANVSLSGNLRHRLARATFSLVHTAGLGSTGGTRKEDTTQLRLGSGINLFGGKLRLALDGSFNPDPPAGERSVPDQRWRMEYYTQCCGFLAEYLSRDFSIVNRRKEFRFTVDLRGIGKLLDLHAGQDQ